jgi:hypothetical protein
MMGLTPFPENSLERNEEQAITTLWGSFYLTMKRSDLEDI